jgi:hypothetical protein
MTSRKFLFGGLLVVASLAFATFLVRCSFVPIKPLDDPKVTREITMLSTTATTGSTISKPETTTFETTTTTLETTALKENTTSSQTVLAPETTVSQEMTIVETTVSQTGTTETTVETSVDIDQYTFVKTFAKGTYYPDYVNNGLKGGSGRSLIDCATGNEEVKGSVACRYIYENYKYNYSGGRTKVYLRIPAYPDMDGFYYVDDCCSRMDVIDFYWYKPCQCPFYDPIGIAENIDCWIVEE